MCGQRSNSRRFANAASPRCEAATGPEPLQEIVDQLRDTFPGTTHVTTAGLDTESDRRIWGYAREHDYMIASKDSDFRQLAFLYGPPPKVVWLRVGNASTARVLQLILDHHDDLVAFEASQDSALLVVPRLPS